MITYRVHLAMRNLLKLLMVFLRCIPALFRSRSKQTMVELALRQQLATFAHSLMRTVGVPERSRPSSQSLGSRWASPPSLDIYPSKLLTTISASGGRHSLLAFETRQQVGRRRIDPHRTPRLSGFPGSAVFTIATRGEKRRDCCGQLRDLANRAPADEF
jgi:hypothetical protein